MAPEQTTGHTGAVGPAADVYALGVILYEALTGRPPFRAATVLETLEQVRTREPVPPGRLQPGLPRDLQTICLKCLEKEPARRYTSARELADDLGRFQRHEPTRARPAGAARRLAKWVRRRPAPAALIAASGLFLATLVTGVLVHNAQLRAAAKLASDNEELAQRRQRLAAEQYAQARETINRMLARLEGRGVAEVPRLKELSQEQLEDALVFYQRALEQMDDPDPRVYLDTALAYKRAADIQGQLGRHDLAAENYGRAIRLVEGLPDDARDAPFSLDLLVACYTNLALANQSQGKWDEAKRYDRAALAIIERTAEARPGDPAPLAATAQCEHDLGVVSQLTLCQGEAEDHYNRAIALRTRLVRDWPDRAEYQSVLAQSYINLASLYQNTDRRAQARAAYEKIEALLLPLINAHPDKPEYRLAMAVADVNWGFLLADDGRHSDAQRVFDQAVDYLEAMLRREPNLATVRINAWKAHSARAQHYERQRHFADAVKDWERAVELDTTPEAWTGHVFLATALVRAGDHARAVSVVAAQEGKADVPTECLYYLAGVCARAAEAASTDARLAPAERNELVERYGARGVGLLRKLRDRGFFKDLANLWWLVTDENLKALRGRDDFKKLLAPAGANKPE
jgi:serine/threonine-protein kinase